MVARLAGLVVVELEPDVRLIVVLIAVALAAGLLAGAYPALLLSGLKPAVVRAVGRDDYLYLLMPIRVS